MRVDDGRHSAEMGAEILKRDVLIYMKQDGPIVSSEVGTQLSYIQGKM